MNKTAEPTETAWISSKRARLHALMFNRAAYGTALATPGGSVDPKLPPFVGE